MGKGTKRKSNDSVRINRSRVAPNERGGGSTRGEEYKEDINNICPPSFKVRLKPKGKVVEGSPVTVRHGRLFVFDQEVGVLSEKDARTLRTCATEGIEYRGRVTITNDFYYARFEQS